MPITDILLLSFFIFAFVALTAALAWGDYQTHDIAKKSRAAALAGTPPEKSAALVEASKKPKTRVHA
jgi:hypothetical protein